MTLADKANLLDVITTLADIRNLARLPQNPAFARLPLAELTTYGFELLIEKALA